MRGSCWPWSWPVLSPTVVDAADVPAPVPVSGSLPLMTSAPLPSMALDPQVPESLYHGLYVGSEVFGGRRARHQGRCRW